MSSCHLYMFLKQIRSYFSTNYVNLTFAVYAWHFVESNPAYVYSVGSSLVLADVSIDDRHPDNITAWPRVVLSDRGRVQALAAHVERALVYFSDTDAGAVYRTNRNEWDVAELTVQQPHVEG